MSEAIERFTLRDPYGSYGEYVLAADYDRLAVMTRELMKHCGRCISRNSWGDKGPCEICTKLAALIKTGAEGEK